MKKKTITHYSSGDLYYGEHDGVNDLKEGKGVYIFSKFPYSGDTYLVLSKTTASMVLGSTTILTAEREEATGLRGTRKVLSLTSTPRASAMKRNGKKVYS